MDEEDEKDEEPKFMRVVWKNPNPLFVKWITEWLEEARKRNMQLQYNLEKALESLKKFPLPLKSGKECLILEHFGICLCKKLDRELEKYKLTQLETKAKSQAIPGPSTSGNNKLPLKDPFSVLEQPVKIKNELKDKIVPENDEMHNNFNYRGTLSGIDKHSPKKLSQIDKRSPGKLLQIDKQSPEKLFQIDKQSPEKLLQIDKKSPKKLSQIDSTSNVRSSCTTSVTLRTLKLAAKNASEINFTQHNLGKNTDRSPAKRKHDEESPQKNASSPKKPSNLGSSLASTSIESSTFEAKKQIRTSPSKRKLNLRSPKKSPRKPENPFLFADENDSNTAPLSQLSSIGSCSQSLEEAFTFLPGEFTVKLLVDTAETSGHTAKRSRREEEATAYLTELGVPFEVRHLTVGDFVWVCQDATSRELLLPFIVERKRSDDLAKSIKDGRFREQKFRLKQLPIAERIYLVEELKKKDRTGLPFSTLMQAATNTQVVDGFKVKFTDNLKHSMQYLATMTEYLSETFCKKVLMSCPKDELPPFNIKDDLARLMTFKDFSRDTGKKRKYTVGEMFLKHLLQLRGMSVEKAKALVGLYPTPVHLMEAFQDYSAASRRMMLAKLKIGPLGRSLGPVLSAAIHDLYTKDLFD